MIALCCFVPPANNPATDADLKRAKTPLLHGGGTDPWTNHNFVAATDLNVNGLIGGNTKYLQTGIIPSKTFASINSGGLTIYNLTSSNSTWREIGCAETTHRLYLITSYNDSKHYFAAFADNNSRVIVNNPGYTGFISGNRTAAARNDTYIGKSSLSPQFQLLGTSTTVQGAGSGLPTSELIAFAYDSSGTIGEFSGRRLSFIAIHEGLSATECEHFYTLVQALRVALGGGYL